MALLDREKVERVADIARSMTYVELSMEPQFMDRYVASLFLPHTDETLFPSVTERISHTTLTGAYGSSAR